MDNRNNNKLTKLKTVVASGVLLTMSGSAFASAEFNSDHCDIELNYDLSISPEHIRIIDQDETMIDIFKDTRLFVRGDQITLSPEQQELVTEYSKSIRRAVPQAGELAVQAVSLAYEGIQAALGDHVDLSNSREKFDRLEQRISEKFNNDSGHYSFRQGEFSFDNNNEEIDVMVEEIVEDMVPQLIGGLLSNIGQAMANGDDDFSSLENLGENIEQEIEGRAEEIEKSADEFCYSLKKVDDLETELVASNDNFSYFDVLTFKEKSQDSK